MKYSERLTRRQMVKAIGVGTAATAVGLEVPSLFGAAAGSNQLLPVRQLATAFNLEQVRLLDGPFLKAQQLNARYLLQLEPDRMLHNFRVNAGLKPKAPVYGGWESVGPWIEIKCHGHTLGHYLTACSLMFASTGDTRFRQRVDYIVYDLKACQKAGRTGLICAFPDGSAPLDQIRNPTRFVGVPWYTMHKIFAGLRDAHLYTNNKVALDVLVRLSDWAITHTRDLTEEQFQKMLATEHGGMNEVLGDVYALTRDDRYLVLAKKFSHRALLDPLSQQRDTLDGLHSNTQIPKVVGFNRLYELTGEDTYGSASKFFWSTVVNTRTFVTGGNGDVEHFFPPAQFGRRLNSSKTMETCCTHNMLRLTRSLFTLDPSVNYVDYYERALYNSILASQDPDSGMMTYFQSTRPGYLKLYCTPKDSFWCCTGSGIENHAKYGDSIYFKNADTLYVNLFMSSVLKWRDKGVTVTQTTRFPDEETTRFRIASRRPVQFSLNVRHPSWCEQMTIRVNGGDVRTSKQRGSYVAVNRAWRNGDTVEVKLPMTLRLEQLPGEKDLVAMVYGPIVLAGRLGKAGLSSGADIIVNERTVGDVLKDTVVVPRFKGDDILAKVKQVGPLVFRTEGIGDPSDVELVPYFRIHHERYNLYWQTGT
jgi:uncharacterized protein